MKQPGDVMETSGVDDDIGCIDKVSNVP